MGVFLYWYCMPGKGYVLPFEVACIVAVTEIPEIGFVDKLYARNSLC